MRQKIYCQTNKHFLKQFFSILGVLIGYFCLYIEYKIYLYKILIA
jgi:hypothetical protein